MTTTINRELYETLEELANYINQYDDTTTITDIIMEQFNGRHIYYTDVKDYDGFTISEGIKDWLRDYGTISEDWNICHLLNRIDEDDFYERLSDCGNRWDFDFINEDTEKLIKKLKQLKIKGVK